MQTPYHKMTGPDGLIAKRLPFTGNSLSAKWEGNRPYYGRLYPDEVQHLTDTFGRAGVIEAMVYVVYSYSTPIAWAIEGEPAYCTPQGFSRTTSKGQNYVRAWINHNYRQDAA